MYEHIIRRLETQDTFQLDREICRIFGLPTWDILNNIHYAMHLKPHNYHAVVSSMGWAHLIPIKPEGEPAEFIEGRMDGQPAMSLCLACIKARDIEDSKFGTLPTVQVTEYAGEMAASTVTTIQGRQADRAIMDGYPVAPAAPFGRWATTTTAVPETVMTLTDLRDMQGDALRHLQMASESQRITRNPYLEPPTIPYPVYDEAPRTPPRRTRSWPPAPRDIGTPGEATFTRSVYNSWLNPPTITEADENE